MTLLHDDGPDELDDHDLAELVDLVEKVMTAAQHYLDGITASGGAYKPGYSHATRSEEDWEFEHMLYGVEQLHYGETDCLTHDDYAVTIKALESVKSAVLLELSIRAPG
jgi:hypothetical protein